MSGRRTGWLAATAMILSVLWASHRVHDALAEVAQEDGDSVDFFAQEVVRTSGKPVLVLRERGGERRLPIPVSAAEAAMLEEQLRGQHRKGRVAAPLASSSIRALGGRLVRASIDTLNLERVFAGHLEISRGGSQVEVDASVFDLILVALEQGAPIAVSAEVVERAAVTPAEAKSLGASSKARSLTRGAGSLPVLQI